WFGEGRRPLPTTVEGPSRFGNPGLAKVRVPSGRVLEEPFGSVERAIWPAGTWPTPLDELSHSRHPGLATGFGPKRRDAVETDPAQRGGRSAANSSVTSRRCEANRNSAAGRPPARPEGRMPSTRSNTPRRSNTRWRFVADTSCPSAAT